MTATGHADKLFEAMEYLIANYGRVVCDIHHPRLEAARKGLQAMRELVEALDNLEQVLDAANFRSDNSETIWAHQRVAAARNALRTPETKR